LTSIGEFEVLENSCLESYESAHDADRWCIVMLLCTSLLFFLCYVNMSSI